MNLLDILHGLARRWYIIVPGVLVAAAAVYGMWQVTPPEYTRSASQLLLPGEGLLPDGATNRFLFIGGLAPVADVLVRSVNADEEMHALLEANPGAEIEVGRDTMASGPVVVATVTAPEEAMVAPLIENVLALTTDTLARLQREEGISARDRVALSTIAVDQQSEIRVRDRMVVSAVAGLGVLLLTVVLASVVDGVLVHSRRRKAAVEPADMKNHRREDPSSDQLLGSAAEPVDDEDRLLGEDVAGIEDALHALTRDHVR